VADRPWLRAIRVRSGSRRPRRRSPTRPDGVEHPPCASAAHLASDLNDQPDDEREQDRCHTQLSTVCTAADPVKEPRPASARTAAGAAAHRWGWSLNRFQPPRTEQRLTRSCS
jgi:hypothetical protein